MQELWFLYSAHPLMLVDICMKFHDASLQLHGHHSYFRKGFQMLLSVLIVCIASTSCTRSLIATIKLKIISLKIRKN